MHFFDKQHIDDLKAKLYETNIHDSIFVSKLYKNGCLTVNLENKYFKEKIELVFKDVKILWSYKNDFFLDRVETEGGNTDIVDSTYMEIPMSLISEWNSTSDDEIIILAIEDNYDFIQKCSGESKEFFEDYLYLLFQMNSCDELHIVTKYVAINTKGLGA